MNHQKTIETVKNVRMHSPRQAIGFQTAYGIMLEIDKICITERLNRTELLEVIIYEYLLSRGIDVAKDMQMDRILAGLPTLPHSATSSNEEIPM